MNTTCLAGSGLLALGMAMAAQAASPQRLLQSPVMSASHLAFVSGGDIWVAPRGGGKATRITSGIGIEQAPSLSPDGQTIAFTGEYDGNTDVFTVPVAGGVPKRLTFHPSADHAVGWSPDGTRVIFRSNRDAASRYTRLWQVNAGGGAASALPLPMAAAGMMAPDGKSIAYTPQEQGFSFNHTRYTAWGNYRGGLTGAVWITSFDGLKTRKVPQDGGADFAPVWLGGQVYFLSGRKGPVSVYRFDPASGQTVLVWQNRGPDIRSLATDGKALVFDRLGTIHTLVPGEEPKPISIDLDGDMPDVRPRVASAATEVRAAALSPTGLRVAVEAHGEIISLPVKEGITRTITATPGTMERTPTWSPDGQSIAYFSDAGGLYALHVANQQGADKAVKTYALAPEPAYYFNPKWSPDGKRIAFQDNRLNTWILDLGTGKLVAAGPADEFGGFAAGSSGMAWSPDSAWFVYARTSGNHFPVLMLHEVATGKVTQITDAMAMSSDPAFDRDGKYLYFLASNNGGGTIYPLDMSSDVYQPNRSVYAIALNAGTASPLAPELGDEKPPAPAAAPEKADTRKPAQSSAKPAAAPATSPIKIDLAGLSLDQIARRTVVLPLPAADYRNLEAGKGGVLWVLKANEALDLDGDEPPGASLIRWTLEGKKSETLLDKAQSFSLSADGSKLLVRTPGPVPAWLVADASKPIKPSDPDVKLKTDGLMVRIDPAAEWAQMYREIWRVQRAYFYDPNFHGYDVTGAEKALSAYLPGIQSRGDLNYLFHEALTGFSIGHLRGGGGAIPAAKRVPGGLLGADYEIRDGRWCLARILTGESWYPQAKPPLARPGLDVKAGDCITAINGADVRGDEDIQRHLEGTANSPVILTIARAGAAPREVTVVPVDTESGLRQVDWIEGNRRRVDRLSGGKLGYVYLPNTGGAGFTNFNRYYFAQTDRQGMVIDDRFNGGGQAADYMIEVMNRRLISWWQPRYGRIDRTPAAAVLGPKVMLINEGSASGGDMLPWMFRDFKLGPLVGKRTWGGLVGIGGIPPLMDGGQLTSPSVGFFSPQSEWAVENIGVPPDVEVDQEPAAVMAGGDPQLEKAVALAMEALAKNPPPSPKRPPFPLYGPDGPIRR